MLIRRAPRWIQDWAYQTSDHVPMPTLMTTTPVLEARALRSRLTPWTCSGRPSTLSRRSLRADSQRLQDGDRIAIDHGEQNTRRSVRSNSSLFPVTERTDAHAEGTRKLVLREADLAAHL